VQHSSRFLLLSAGLAAILAAATDCRAAGETRVRSPNGSVQVRVLPEGGRLHFGVTLHGKPVIEASPMQFTVDGVDLTEGAEPGRTETYQVNETYPWRGAHGVATNRCNGARVAVRHAQSGTAYTLEVRAFDDGVAFRYLIAGEEKPRVPDEGTTFVLPAGSTAWYHDLEGHYEGVHTKKPVEEARAGEWAAPPLTFKLPGGTGYASITEADLVDYSGMALQADGRRGFRMRLGHSHPASYPFRLRYGLEEARRLSAPAAVAGTITTPWRVVMVGPDLNALVNCDVVHDLCPPPDPKLFPRGLDTAWVKPGRAVWKYLDGGPSTLDGMKDFCRMAGELGFEYNVIEGFWSRWSDAEIRELVEYARQHHVGIWLWKHSKSLRDLQARHDFLKRCHDLGVAGVKIDFFDHEAKELIDLYQALLRETAENQLLVNFHGANKPTGESRTWPNELTREAVKGMEARKLADRATHDVTLPFTRLLAGPADYTPVHFGERRGNTTWAHQVASAALLDSPLLTYAANPATLLASPACEMIKSIPSTWDETIVLPPSEIGEVAVFARRKGATWFLAAMNGKDARKVSVPLTFLAEGEHRALLVRDDGSDAAALTVDNTTLKRGDLLAIDLREGGGFIARFSPR
jgi:alpha-glucosidase